MAAPRRNIAVAGAGIGGLAFAALAARNGNNVVVFDQFDQPRPVGSGLVIQPVGQAVLSEIEAEDAAVTLGQNIARMLGHEVDRGRKVLDVHYDRGNNGRFGLAIHRASLFQCLLDAALSAGAELEQNHEIAVQDGQYLCFADGRRAGSFDLIVDALGAGSPMSPLKARALDFGAIWGTVPWVDDTTLPQDQLTQKYRRADKMAGILPIGYLPGETNPLTAVFWSLPRGAFDDWRNAPLEAWKVEAATLWPEFAPFLQTIETHDDMTMAVYSHGQLWRPAEPGLARIGDAAHRASPQLGQGANMALLDAYALAIALGRHDLGDALSAYVKARRWHVLAYQWMSAAFTPQYQSDSRILPGIRDVILGPLSVTPPFPRILTRLVCGNLLPPYGSLS